MLPRHLTLNLVLGHFLISKHLVARVLATFIAIFGMKLTMGKRYGIQVDESKKFLTMQYNFKPASVDNSQPGILSLAAPNVVTEASLKLATTSSSSSSSNGTNHVTLSGTSTMNPATDRVLVYDPSTDTLHMHKIGQCITGLKRRRDLHDDVEVEDVTRPRHQKRALNELIRKGKKKKERKGETTSEQLKSNGRENGEKTGEDCDNKGNGDNVGKNEGKGENKEVEEQHSVNTIKSKG